MKILVASLGVAALTLQSCSTYEDGPAISLKTKNSRLTGEWKLVDAGVLDLSDIDIEFEFEKDGDFKMTMSYAYDNYEYSYSYKGDWEWVSGKESVIVTTDGDATTYEILKLTSDELVLEYSYGSYVQEWSFEKQ
jgi:hypothetical protein